MYERSRDVEESHLAPVSYLPWAAPGVTNPGGDARPARAGAGVDAGLGAGAHGDARASRRRREPREKQASGDARESGEPAEAETGVERDQRIDRLVISRLRRSSLSVAEVRRVLSEHGLDESEVEQWIERYARLGYLDDARLAEQLVHTGAERRGRGSGAILAELGRRGVDPAAARAALEELDPDLERQNALAVAERRARQLGGLDHAVAERRLTAFLQRRGYATAVIRDAVANALGGDSS